MCVGPELLSKPHDEDVSATMFVRLLAPITEKAGWPEPALVAVEELRGCQPAERRLGHKDVVTAQVVREKGTY